MGWLAKKRQLKSVSATNDLGKFRIDHIYFRPRYTAKEVLLAHWGKVKSCRLCEKCGEGLMNYRNAHKKITACKCKRTERSHVIKGLRKMTSCPLISLRAGAQRPTADLTRVVYLQIQSHRVHVAAAAAEGGLLDGRINNNKDARDGAHHHRNVLKCCFFSFLADDEPGARHSPLKA